MRGVLVYVQTGRRVACPREPSHARAAAAVRLPAAPRTRWGEGGQRLGLLKQLTCVPGAFNQSEADGWGGCSQQSQCHRHQAEGSAQGGRTASHAAFGMPQVVKNLYTCVRATLSGQGHQWGKVSEGASQASNCPLARSALGHSFSKLACAPCLQPHSGRMIMLHISQFYKIQSRS